MTMIAITYESNRSKSVKESNKQNHPSLSLASVINWTFLDRVSGYQTTRTSSFLSTELFVL